MTSGDPAFHGRRSVSPASARSFTVKGDSEAELPERGTETRENDLRCDATIECYIALREHVLRIVQVFPGCILRLSTREFKKYRPISEANDGHPGAYLLT